MTPSADRIRAIGRVPGAMMQRWQSLVAQKKHIESAAIYPGGGWYIKVRTLLTHQTAQG